MTGEDAEHQVWERWREVAEHCMGCAMRVEPSLTEEYEWGWVVYLAPVWREECRRNYPYDRYACERQEGRSTPVGTKGVKEAIVRLGVVTEADWRERPASEVAAMWNRLMRRCT
jgi:hypothetical protein